MTSVSSHPQIRLISDEVQMLKMVILPVKYHHFADRHIPHLLSDNPVNTAQFSPFVHQVTHQVTKMAAPFTAGGVAIITGGASGIGFSLAKKCQGYGMRVIIADRDNDALEAATKTLGADVTPFKMDVAQKEGWEALRKTVDEKFDSRFAHSPRHELAFN